MPLRKTLPTHVMLQHTASQCKTLQHTATRCNTLQHTDFDYQSHAATHCNTATHCNSQQHTAAHCYTLQHTATLCSTLQHTAAHCNTLQHTATHCNTLAFETHVVLTLYMNVLCSLNLSCWRSMTERQLTLLCNSAGAISVELQKRLGLWQSVSPVSFAIPLVQFHWWNCKRDWVYDRASAQSLS